MSENVNLSGGNDEPQLTDEQLFAQISKAVRSNDDEALNALVIPETEARQAEVEVEEVVTSNGSPDPVAETVTLETNKEVGNNEPELDEKDKLLAKLRQDLEEQTRLNHQLKSDAGRVPALRRELLEIKERLQKQSEEPAPAATRNVRVKNEKLAQIKEADPLLAEAVEEAIEAVADEMRQEAEKNKAQTKEFLDAAKASEQEALLDQEYSKLLKVAPNAAEIFAHPLWKEWQSLVPPNLQRMADSIYADEVMVAFEQFAKYVAYKHPELVNRSNPEPVKEVTTPATVENPEAKRIAEERAKKLKTPTPSSSTAGIEATSDEPADETKLFSYFYKQEREKNSR